MINCKINQGLCIPIAALLNSLMIKHKDGELEYKIETRDFFNHTGILYLQIH